MCRGVFLLSPLPLCPSAPLLSRQNARVDYSGIERFNLTGTSFDDDLRGGAFNDTLNGGAGNDTLTASSGTDRLVGGLGIDLVTVDFSLATVAQNVSNTGTSMLSNGTTFREIEAFNLTTGSGNDTISLTGDFNDTIFTGSGNDTIRTSGGNDSLDGGEGNDTLNGGAGNDTINGGGGNDSLIGDGGNDNLIGGEGRDTLNTGLGVDRVNGGAGTDVLVVNYSPLDSSSGVSYFSYRPTNGSGGFQVAGQNARVDYSGIEQFNLTGTSFDDDLRGGAFNDTLNGGAGNDTLSGGAGHDILSAGLGLTDTVNGETGTDVLVVNYSSLTTNITQSSTSIQTSGNQTTYSNIERFNLTGGSGNDALFGGSLADTLSGGAGNDTLTGRAGNDTLTGRAGDDLLIGGLGNDILVGGFGNDTLTGSGGADSFTFNAVDERVDTITDFVAVDDRIVVSAAGFGGRLIADAAITATQFVLGTAATNAIHRFIYDTTSGTNGALLFDADGTGSIAAVRIATLSTEPSITNADIYVTA